MKTTNWHIEMHWSLRLQAMGKIIPKPLSKETKRLMHKLRRKNKLERLRKKLKSPMNNGLIFSP